jgi:acetylornithine deacetylase/succinyl-diaminopimelate desuccinylase-like protein
MGEESGQHGAKALAQEEHFDFVIAGEPTDLQTVHAHKGSLWVTLESQGRAVHASAPEQGENAIYAMTQAIEAIRTEIIPKLERLIHPLLGRTTLSVGSFRIIARLPSIFDSSQESMRWQSWTFCTRLWARFHRAPV